MTTQPTSKDKKQKPPEGEKTSEVPVVADTALSLRFTNMVVKEFSAISGRHTALDESQKRLAQHLFVKIDASLQDLEKKRQDKDDKKTPIVWGNINMTKLALDAMYRIELGLDALIPNHISVIPYFNSRMKKYDIDLRIGYVGKDYYRRQVAIDPPKDIRYELVHTNDVLTVFMKSRKNTVEDYEFDVPKPFDRGEVKGGFAYIVYDEPTKNKLILLGMDAFKRAESAAQSKDFWNRDREAMQYKTIVNRATDKLQIDPKKVNAAFLAVENDDSTDAGIVQSQIEDKANKGEVLDLKAEPEVLQGDGNAEASDQETGPAEVADPVCVCDQMTRDKLKDWDCPVHGRYQGGKFTKPESARKPNF